MSGEGSREGRYTAFLSYSHKDAAAAGRLHRRLEAYRMPRRLAGTEGARGAIPDRLWPIFRDREELPAATDLSETVRAALAQSGALIILCSPHAAASLWVAEEIETFRRLHPDRPILAAVLDGDPPDCFPAALRAFGRDGTWHEPLATDLRPHRDGARLGLLKLVAGITGVGLDALVQRDAMRRVRRVTAMTVAALTAMLVMGAMTVLAFRARGEAEAQRAESENLIEFMMTDLRGRLRADVGRLDVMQSVNERALAHYQRQSDLSALTADELELRARVLQAMSEDDVTQGNLAGALAAAQAAYRTTEAQLARAPGDRERLFYHAQSEYWLGRVDELRGHWGAAQRRYAHYADAADRLILLAPNDPRYMMEVAYSSTNLGTVQLNGARNALAARRLYEKAATWFGRAARARPNDLVAPIAQANALAWLADSYFRSGRWPESLAQRTEQYRIAARLHDSRPDNVQALVHLAAARLGMGRALVMMGRSVEGRALQIEARSLFVGLTQRDPGNVEWLYLRGNAECGLYFGPGPQLAPSRSELGASIHAVAAALASRHDPRAVDFDRCIQLLH
jgi:tetratricopeptide (TPR) repeat protein